MLKLIVNPGTDQTWEIPLPAGSTTLGSEPSQPFSIAHESVSPSHCEILVTEGSATIRDLASTCGTFVNHEQVSEARIAAGQTIALGEVELLVASDVDGDNAPSTKGSAIPIPRRIDTTAPVRVPALAIIPHSAAEATQSPTCKYHRKAPSRWFCPQCHLHFCDLCITTRRVEGEPRHLCRACGSSCEAVEAAPAAEESAQNFYAQLPGAFAYPFKGSGVILLVGGAACSLLLGWLPFTGMIIGGYAFSYAKDVISSTAAGDQELPDWPDFTDWWDNIIAPYGQFLGLFLLSFGPALVLKWWHPGGAQLSAVLTLLFIALGALLAPMGMLALSILDTIGALNPIGLILSIARVPVHYLAAAAAFELVIAANLGVDWLMALLPPVPIVLNLLSGFITLYLVVVGMRILGLLYRTDKDRLAWV